MARPRLSPKSKEALKLLGENLRRERKKKGYTQEKLAELVDVHPQVIQKLESGRTNILATTAMRIQAALRCDWSDLMPTIDL